MINHDIQWVWVSGTGSFIGWRPPLSLFTDAETVKFWFRTRKRNVPNAIAKLKKMKRQRTAIGVRIKPE
jgi:hypothetical protein